MAFKATTQVLDPGTQRPHTVALSIGLGIDDGSANVFLQSDSIRNEGSWRAYLYRGTELRAGVPFADGHVELHRGLPATRSVEAMVSTAVLRSLMLLKENLEKQKSAENQPLLRVLGIIASRQEHLETLNGELTTGLDAVRSDARTSDDEKFALAEELLQRYTDEIAQSVLAGTRRHRAGGPSQLHRSRIAERQGALRGLHITARHATRQEARLGTRRGTGGTRQHSGLDRRTSPVQEGCRCPQETLGNMGRVPGHRANVVESSGGVRGSVGRIKVALRRERMHQFHQFQENRNTVKPWDIWEI